MQCLLIFAHDDAFIPSANLVAAIHSWIAKAEEQGIRVHGNPLRPAVEAVTIRIRNEKLIRTEGPFAPSRENICAYELLETADLEQAIAAATEHPMAAVATIEVRPVWEFLAESRTQANR
jgi:hypothetical protein